MLNFRCASVVILYKSSFSSNSHAWTVATVTFTWQCIFNDTAYNVTHMLLLPEDTVQLTLDDNTAVHFPYRSSPYYRPCPVCLKQIPANEIITLHIFRHIPHYTCPPCSDFLLSRGFLECPVCKNPHLYFRLDASRIPSTILAQATSPHRSIQRPLHPRRTSRRLNNEE